MAVQLRSQHRSQLEACRRRKPEFSKHAIQRGQREFRRCRDFNSDRLSTTRKVDDEPGLDTTGPRGLLPGFSREIVVRGQRPPVSKRDFKIRLFHDSSSSTGYAVTTTWSLPRTSGSMMISQAARLCRASTTHRPSTMSCRNPVACSSIRRKSTSVNRRSVIRFRRCGLNSSSHSHHSGHVFFLRARVPPNVHHSGFVLPNARRITRGATVAPGAGGCMRS